MPPSLAKNWGMPNKDRSFHESPQKAGGEGLLYSEQQLQRATTEPNSANGLNCYRLHPWLRLS